MYTSFFGLHEKPFSITPDPRYLFLSERHGEALAHLVYGVTESGGFVQLTGEVGTGKTTLVRSLLQSRMPDNADVAVVLNPQITVQEFLLTICEELGIEVTGPTDSTKALTDALNRHLLSAHSEGRRTILIVDEAQNLAPAVLEQVRLLTNLETAKQKLLQIILIGQPELRELLGRNDLRQLAQRITGRYHLEPLTRLETAQYIEHRLQVAGALGEVLDTSAKNEVYRLSKGVPRLVNVICDRALLGGYAEDNRIIGKRLIRRAADEVSGELETSTRSRAYAVAAGVAAVAIVLAGFWLVSSDDVQNEPVAEIPPATESSPVALKVAEPVAATVMVETPVATEPEPERASLAQELSLAGQVTTADFAFDSLFDLWDLEYTTGASTACTQAAAAGLACLTQRSSWNGLRMLNHPAILTLVDLDGRTHEVVLTAINNDGTADLSIGGVKVTHPVSAVTEFWYGQFMLLWRPPGGAPVSLARGSRGEEVLWLRRSLANIDDNYITDALESDEFDRNLEDIVRRFQRDYRLDVDGLAGQQTLIVVNSLLAPDGTPRLTMPTATTAQLLQD